MSERRDSAGRVDERNRLFDRQRLLRQNLPGEWAEDAVERLSAVMREPACHEQSRNVPPPETWARFFHELHTISRKRKTASGELRHVVAEPFAPACREAGQRNIQLRVIG